MLSLQPKELDKRLKEGEAFLLIDVREQEELDYCPFPLAQHYPLSQLSTWIDELSDLEQSNPIVIVCHHGIRSARVCSLIAALCPLEVWNLTGGLELWAQQVDPSMPRYISRHTL